MLFVAEEAALVGEGCGVGHVDGDGVAVAEGNRWCELYDDQLSSIYSRCDAYLMKRAPGVTVGNDTVQTNLVEVGCLELQHLKDTSAVYLIRSLSNLGVHIVTTET